MSETRKTRHDLRQHLTVVQPYIDHDDKRSLAEYMDLYESGLPTDTLEYFCDNGVMNAIVSYHATQAWDAGIAFSADVTSPRDCPVSDTDMTVLLGNLLKNAVEASKWESQDRPFLNLRVKWRDWRGLRPAYVAWGRREPGREMTREKECSHLKATISFCYQF